MKLVRSYAVINIASFNQLKYITIISAMLFTVLFKQHLWFLCLTFTSECASVTENSPNIYLTEHLYSCKLKQTETYV